MKKVLFATVLLLNFSIAHAQGFDWMSISKEINVGNEYNAVVSIQKYEARWEAEGHCKQLGRQIGLDMRLADLQEVIKIAAFGKPQNTDMMVKVVLKDGTEKYGIVAWDNKKPIKIDIKNRANKDTKVVFTFRGGSGAVAETSLIEMNESDFKTLTYQDAPVKKLPAFCVHNNKKK